MTSTNNLENILEPIKNSSHEDVQLNNQINTANHDYNNDVEMENGHLTNGKCKSSISCVLPTSQSPQKNIDTAMLFY